MEINGEVYIHQLVDQVRRIKRTSYYTYLQSRIGFLDEFLRLFVCIKHLEKSEIDQLEGKLTGLRVHGESITLKLVDMENAWQQSPDAKLLSSLALYRYLQSRIEK
jgi:ADP-sugar diphosphatase